MRSRFSTDDQSPVRIASSSSSSIVGRETQPADRANVKIQDMIKGFLSPYRVPRYAVAKVRDILLVQPKLLTTRNRKRLLNHPEYNRSRDLFEVVVKGLDFDHDLLKYWPEQQNTPKKRGRKKE